MTIFISPDASRVIVNDLVISLPKCVTDALKAYVKGQTK